MIQEKYLQNILYHYHKNKENYLEGLLTSPTPGKIKKAFLKRTNGLEIEKFSSGTTLDANDKKLIQQINPDDAAIIKKFVTGKDGYLDNIFKPFSNFLNGSTKQLNSIKAADFLAFILDFPYRPLSLYKNENLQYEVAPIPANKQANNTQIASNKQVSYSAFKIVEILLILSVILLIIWSVYNILNHNKQPQIQNITHFNENNHYYYYKQNDSIIVKDKTLLSKEENQKSSPLTPVVMDAYFVQQGEDTTHENYKQLKARYFKNQKIALIGLEDNNKKRSKTTQTKKIKTEKSKDNTIKKIDKTTNITKNSLSFDIKNGEEKDLDVQAILQTHYQKKYTISNLAKTHYVCNGNIDYHYRKSKKFANQTVCDLYLNYQIVDMHHKTIAQKSYHTTGSGFSKTSAKTNGLMKLKNLINKE